MTCLRAAVDLNHPGLPVPVHHQGFGHAVDTQAFRSGGRRQPTGQCYPDCQEVGPAQPPLGVALT